MNWCHVANWSPIITIIALILSFIFMFLRNPNAPSIVSQLSKETIKKFCDKPQPSMVMVYADWCPHCTILKPKFYDAAAAAPTVDFAIVDGDKAKDFVKSRHIKGFPYIFGVSKQGVMKKYSGNRTVKSLIEFSESI